MRRTKIAIVAAVAALLVATASAQAAPQTTVLNVREFVIGSSADCIFTVSGPLLEATGAPTGSFEACVKEFNSSTEPFYSQTSVQEIAYTLPGGTIFATVRTHELLVTPSRLTYAAKGEITGGTGIYNGATGRIVGNGIIGFASGIDANIHFILQVR